MQDSIALSIGLENIPVPLLEDKLKIPSKVAAFEANNSWAQKLLLRKGLFCLGHKTGSYLFLGKIEVGVEWKPLTSMSVWACWRRGTTP